MTHLPLCPYNYRAGKASPQTTTAQRDTYRQQKHCGAGVAEARLGTAAQASALSAHSGKTEKMAHLPLCLYNYRAGRRARKQQQHKETLTDSKRIAV